jgi:hypothetical protein
MSSTSNNNSNTITTISANYVGRKCFWIGTKLKEDGSTGMEVIQGLVISTSRLLGGAVILQIRILEEEKPAEESRIVSIPLMTVFFPPSN